MLACLLIIHVCVFLIYSPLCHITIVNTVAFFSIVCTNDAVSLPVFPLSLPCIVCCCPPLQSPASPFQVCSNTHHLPHYLPSCFLSQLFFFFLLFLHVFFPPSLAAEVLTHLSWNGGQHSALLKSDRCMVTLCGGSGGCVLLTFLSSCRPSQRADRWGL